MREASVGSADEGGLGRQCGGGRCEGAYGRQCRAFHELQRKEADAEEADTEEIHLASMGELCLACGTEAAPRMRSHRRRR
jgi:hypothetical protein